MVRQNESDLNLVLIYQNKIYQKNPTSITSKSKWNLCRDDITKLCPDKNKKIDNHQIRYRLNHLNILHQQFELDSNIDIGYVTFTRYVPS